MTQTEPPLVTEEPPRTEPGGDGAQPPQKRRKWTAWLPGWRALAGSALIALAAGCGAFAVGYMSVDMPEPNQAAVAQSNLFLYADGTPMARDGEVDRESVGIERIPEGVRLAVLAAEDRDFYTDSAVNPLAMLRAGWNTATGKGTQSGSTITQQYVKNYYLDQGQTISRKLKEFFIAIKLDREVTKDDILEGYLNTSYFGRNAYGVQAAAKAYFDKDATELNLSEGAYLAALLNAPHSLDVTLNPQNRDAAVARWNYVLDGMRKKRWLTKDQRAALRFPQPQQAKPRQSLSGQRGYLVEAVKHYLTENRIIDEKTLAAGGFRITTTIEPDKQKAFVQAVDDRLESRLSDDNPTDAFVRAGGASIDVRTGHVVALYGGRDYTKQFVNNATRRDYQVGSTFKPFVFAAAVQYDARTRGGTEITPRTMYDGASKRQVTDKKGRKVGYAPENQDDENYGRLSVADATDKSVNAVYAQMAQDVGPRRVRDTAVRLGLSPDTPEMAPHPAIALGAATASVLDMTQAYATLANHGKQPAFSLVEKMTKNGQTYQLPPGGGRRAVSRVAADATTAILESVVEKGSGEVAQESGRPSAGKTGTGEHNRSAWFAGYTPELATVVALMGQDSNTGVQKSLHGALGEDRMSGGEVPAEIWADYTAAALADTDWEDFDLRAGAKGRLPAPPPPPMPFVPAPMPVPAAPLPVPPRPAPRPAPRPVAPPRPVEPPRPAAPAPVPPPSAQR
ncbi:Penicillin-binding protein 1A [Streptomyces sp. RB5]|uniref:Penicillin-binding protein 1A n=1 Tax=Streptomyces smaragdinus TaxID=2585196 RepID=A0A7K0CKC4_9ACTN|nr:transglycosylase domain-containing protein [Streptomyces smaragdinus]MQY13949.1 Penicillin-binding protein 1A [Streptomyces smaragdinus]